jgi:hypothetical protein
VHQTNHDSSREPSKIFADLIQGLLDDTATKISKRPFRLRNSRRRRSPTPLTTEDRKKIALAADGVAIPQEGS